MNNCCLAEVVYKRSPWTKTEGEVENKKKHAESFPVAGKTAFLMWRCWVSRVKRGCFLPIPPSPLNSKQENPQRGASGFRTSRPLCRGAVTHAAAAAAGNNSVKTCETPCRSLALAPNGLGPASASAGTVSARSLRWVAWQKQQPTNSSGGGRSHCCCSCLYVLNVWPHNSWPINEVIGNLHQCENP